jgi:hypothetical protein
MSNRTIEGHIDEVHGGIVYATLVDHSGWSYYAEIDLDRFADVDQPHCAPGVTFTIKDPGPELKLRRPGTWTQEEVDRINAKARRKFLAFSKTVGADAYGSDS